MAQEAWIGNVVKFKSGRYGIVLSIQADYEVTFITVYVPSMGMITIRTKDVEKI